MATIKDSVIPEFSSESLRNFKKLRAGIDIREIKEEISSQPLAWLVNTNRQKSVRVQRNTQSIFLRSARRERDIDISVNEIHESRYTDVSKYFPVTTQWIEEVAQEMRRKVARALIAKLMPHTQVFRHIDEGSYYQKRDRYHVVLVSAGGSRMTCGDESVMMHEGEMWWFDNKRPHESFNDSGHERVHLIFDLEQRGMLGDMGADTKSTGGGV